MAGRYVFPRSTPTLEEHGNDPSRVIGDAAYNKTKSLFNANGLMVEKITRGYNVPI